MMKMFRILLGLIFFWLPMQLVCQVQDTGYEYQNEKGAVEDSIGMPSLSGSYYVRSHALERGYEYQLANKQRNLKMWAANSFMFSAVAMGGFVYLLYCLTLKYNWEEWVPSVVGFSVGAVCLLPGILVMRHLQKKADAIGTNHVAQILLTKNVSLHAVHFTCQGSPLTSNSHALGVGFVVRF